MDSCGTKHVFFFKDQPSISPKRTHYAHGFDFPLAQGRASHLPHAPPRPKTPTRPWRCPLSWAPRSGRCGARSGALLRRLGACSWPFFGRVMRLWVFPLLAVASSTFILFVCLLACLFVCLFVYVSLSSFVAFVFFLSFATTLLSFMCFLLFYSFACLLACLLAQCCFFRTIFVISFPTFRFTEFKDQNHAWPYVPVLSGTRKGNRP